MLERNKTEYFGKMRSCVVPRGPYNISPFFAEKASGALIYDVDGHELIDFASGIAVMNVGHSHPSVVEAIHDQAQKLTHTCWHVVMYEPYVDLADKLCALAPGSFHKMAMFSNSGAEAVENAVKIARFYTNRPDVIAFEHAFHGRTYMAMSLTAKIKPYKHRFGPLASGIHRFPFAYCYRCAFGLKHPECHLFCAEFIKQRLESGCMDPEQIAALIVEPVPGEGGFITPPQGYLKRLQGICREYGIVFVADEVQTGIARTGKMFAAEHFDLEPDLITLAKSLAAGLPLSAVLGRKEIMDAPDVGSLGGTFSGNPISCRAALAVLDIIYQENLLSRAEALGVVISKRLADWKNQYEMIGDVRGLGAMNAVELVRDRQDKTPASAETQRLVRYCYERGVIVLNCGTHGNVIRILAPLVIGEAELERGLAILEEGIAMLNAELSDVRTKSDIRTGAAL